MSEPLRGVFQGLDVIASGLRAEMQRAEVVASNLSNMQSTGNKHHEPYCRKSVVFEEVLDGLSGLDGVPGADRLASGVRVARVVEDRATPFPQFRDPGHPNADADGWVLGSNVDMFHELVDLTVIQRSFDANLQAMRAYRSMLQNTITNMGRS